jgi:23S rRNA (guanosine2251-2'-O)-methyltransferase
MAFLTNRNSILETIIEHADTAARLWVEAGYERVSSDIIEAARKSGTSVRIIPKEQFQKRFKGIRGHICLERQDFAYADPDLLLGRVSAMKNPFFSAFDGIYDPQNLGNIIRSSACLGVDALIIPKDRSAAVTDTVLHVARGGTEHTPVVKVTNIVRYLEELKKRNVFCYGLDEKATANIFDVDLSSPACLVFGTEEGLRRLTRERCDMLVKIPTSAAFPSLNVANAFAIAAYEVMRQRTPPRKP